MITVTEEAKQLFKNVDHPEGTVLRLDPVVTNEQTGETQIGLSAGEPKGDDQVVEHEGESLLHIAGPVSQALDGSTLNMVETPEGPGIGITPPEEGPAVPNGS
jgi:iron-sulfur cluster assembly protein